MGHFPPIAPADLGCRQLAGADELLDDGAGHLQDLAQVLGGQGVRRRCVWHSGRLAKRLATGFGCRWRRGGRP